jgi:fructose-bisphosphate aldolase, class I
MTTQLAETATRLIVSGKGILAADETVATVTKRLEAVSVESTQESRRSYRELFFTTPGITAFISGVILHDETIHQRSAAGIPLPALLAERGIVPGIKVDHGVTALAGFRGELVTEGLDGLRHRLEKYRALGAQFAKWRAVITVSDTLPSVACLQANAHALARYAALCQEQAIVPIVEPEVLMDGVHTIERCEDVTGRVLHEVFDALDQHQVSLEGMLLKPNMVIPGSRCARQVPVTQVAAATRRCLGRHVPAAVPGVVFLSGGQSPLDATLHLNVINQLDGATPWTLTFSYGRALQDEALRAWRGRPENVAAGQRAFYHRARCDSAAAVGKYASAMESEAAA